MRVEKKFKKSGYFWLPGHENKKIPGVLTIENDGEIELEIVGHFNEDFKILEEDNLDRILGNIEEDGFVTLEDCFYINKNYTFGGISKSKIFVHIVLSGATWGKDEIVTFNTFSFSVDCLDEWIGISGIEVQHDLEHNTTTIIYNPPKPISFSLKNDMKIGIHFDYNLPGSPNLTTAKITQNSYFKIISENLYGLEEFITIAHQITNFMSFAMDGVVALKNVSATSTEISSTRRNGRIYNVPILIYFQSISYVKEIPNKKPHNMIFTFNTIRNNAEKIFNNWLNAYESLSPAINLYFSTKVNSFQFLEGKFLALAQGLETYHRRISKETIMEQHIYEELVKKILEGCPDEHKDWLKGRLLHGNEINLGKRIKNIIEPFKELLGTSKERSKLIRNIVDTRNYLTHYSENLESFSVEGENLWELCQKLELIFTLHFLKIIGFT
ncbi:hypothetical protein OHW74_14725, partial [Acinetobacter baumannii]|nr:hypothetical protein [Acinetobacter baumannii]